MQDDNKTTSSLISEAVRKGQLTPWEGRGLLQDLGIRRSFFTKKQVSVKVRKAKRKQQKLSRRKNRKK